jgi:hypothetical protein
MVRPAWGHVIAEDHGAAFPLTRVGRAGSAWSINDPRRFLPAPEVEGRAAARGATYEQERNTEARGGDGVTGGPWRCLRHQSSAASSVVG